MSQNQGSESTEIVLLGDLLPLPDDELSAFTQSVIDDSMPPGTRRKYEGHWARFLAWCKATGRTPLPATPQTVTEFVSYLCFGYISPDTGQRGLSPSTVNQARWAVAKAHERAQVEIPSMAQSMEVLKKYKRELAEADDPRAKPRKATAATKKIVQRFADSASPDRLIGIRDRAMILMHYALGARISEIVSVNIDGITDSSEGLLVSLYRAKTRLHDDWAIPVEHAPSTVVAVRAWRDKLGELGRTSGPLFVRINRHGQIASPIHREGELVGDPDGRLSMVGAERVIKKLASAAGLGEEGPWSGHSLRRGFANEARRAGHDQVRIALGGGWDPRSPVVLGYMEEADKWTNNALEGAGL